MNAQCRRERKQVLIWEGRCVNAFLGRNGLTQYRLASLIGVSQSTLSAKIRGKTAFSLPQLAICAEMFGQRFIRLVIGPRKKWEKEFPNESIFYSGKKRNV